jgi:hypothetical protein
MRTHPISTRMTLILAVIVLLAPMLAISLNIGHRLAAPVQAAHDQRS